MVNESVLLESRTLRTSVLDRMHVLDKVKTLSLLPDGLHVTTAMVAAYYEVSVAAVRSLVADHRGELEANGYHVVTGAELSALKALSSAPSRTAALALFSRRAVLNVGMLLRDSEIARQVRTYLLDTECEASAEPVDNFIHRTGAGSEVTDILRRQVVPLLNLLIAASGEHHRQLVSLRHDVVGIQRKLVEYDLAMSRLQRDQMPRALAGATPAAGATAAIGVMAAIDAMDWREFELHVAALLHRDGCTDLKVYGSHGGNRGVDITARTADGRTIAVQCKNGAPLRHVPSGDMQKFLGAAKVLHRADVALYVATCAFTREALAIAAQGGVTAVHRGLLEAWSTGAPLQALR
ncbi:restriction endonuclease [Streptomyces sp. NPDC127106]|uniref:restriction endonuclease n=1 Tax=Streptomyces sp. NPDC127106 TaxID=3345360 RepID=UPI00364197D0